jgi:molybdopterin converting factor small subunit
LGTGPSLRKRMVSVKIKVTAYGRFKGFIEDEVSLQLEAERATVREALELLCRRYGEGLESTLFDPSTKGIKRSNLVLLNGQSYINLDRRLDSEVKDGDEITLLPVLVGG